MVAVSSTFGSQATQYGWEQLKLQQARRNADRAEQTAQSLQTEATEARRAADRAVENARSLSLQSDQAQTYAGRARQGLAALQSAGQMQMQLGQVADQVIQRQQGAYSSQSAQSAQSVNPAQSAPVVNTQGQLTGTVVNTKA
ncbi:MAG: hypothetical protein WC073_03540 [Sterolibacterium sp.]